MKYLQILQRIRYIASLPVRGAWVEINSHMSFAICTVPSLPVRGAWVEISCMGGKRGFAIVAPRAGSVG